MKYEIFEHTADIGIIIYGSTYDEIFNNSIVAISDLMIDTTNLKENYVHEVSLSSTNPELLMVDLLSLVLFEFEANNILYFRSSLKLDQKSTRLFGNISGDEVEEGVDYRNVIKAVTYHQLEVSPEKGYARVIFDI